MRYLLLLITTIIIIMHVNAAGRSSCPLLLEMAIRRLQQTEGLMTGE
jgi:hypothetical protein